MGKGQRKKLVFARTLHLCKKPAREAQDPTLSLTGLKAQYLVIETFQTLDYSSELLPYSQQKALFMRSMSYLNSYIVNNLTACFSKLIMPTNGKLWNCARQSHHLFLAWFQNKEFPTSTRVSITLRYQSEHPVPIQPLSSFRKLTLPGIKSLPHHPKRAWKKLQFSNTVNQVSY